MALKRLIKRCGFILWLSWYPIQGQSSLVPLDTLLVRAQVLQSQGHFLESISVYQIILKRQGVVPARMCYHLGQALYAVQSFARAERFLTFYLKEVASHEAYYAEAKALRDSARIYLAQIKACIRCDSEGWRYAPDPACQGVGYVQQTCLRCGGQGIRTCPSCFGQSVLISVSLFAQTQYQACRQCEGRGYLTCSSCDGHGHLQQSCAQCKGSGQIISRIRCNHTPKY